jgi:hypothetical protein
MKNEAMLDTSHAILLSLVIMYAKIFLVCGRVSDRCSCLAVTMNEASGEMVMIDDDNNNKNAR